MQNNLKKIKVKENVCYNEHEEVSQKMTQRVKLIVKQAEIFDQQIMALGNIAERIFFDNTTDLMRASISVVNRIRVSRVMTCEIDPGEEKKVSLEETYEI